MPSDDFWKLQIEAIYRRRNPKKLKDVPSLLAKYRGQEAILHRKVCVMYDLDPLKFYTDPAAWREEADVIEDGGASAQPTPRSADPAAGRRNSFAFRFGSGGTAPPFAALAPDREAEVREEPRLKRCRMSVYEEVSSRVGDDPDLGAEEVSVADPPFSAGRRMPRANKMPEARAPPSVSAIPAPLRARGACAAARQQGAGGAFGGAIGTYVGPQPAAAALPHPLRRKIDSRLPGCEPVRDAFGLRRVGAEAYV